MLARFNLVSSAMRDDRRLIGVVLGSSSPTERDRKMIALLDRGFATGAAPPAVAARSSGVVAASADRQRAVADFTRRSGGPARRDQKQGAAPLGHPSRRLRAAQSGPPLRQRNCAPERSGNDTQPADRDASAKERPAALSRSIYRSHAIRGCGCVPLAAPPASRLFREADRGLAEKKALGACAEGSTCTEGMKKTSTLDHKATDRRHGAEYVPARSLFLRSGYLAVGVSPSRRGATSVMKRRIDVARCSFVPQSLPVTSSSVPKPPVFS